VDVAGEGHDTVVGGHSVHLKWFVIGAFLGLTGVVFGLILPKL